MSDHFEYLMSWGVCGLGYNICPLLIMFELVRWLQWSFFEVGSQYWNIQNFCVLAHVKNMQLSLMPVFRIMRTKILWCSVNWIHLSHEGPWDHSNEPSSFIKFYGPWACLEILYETFGGGFKGCRPDSDINLYCISRKSGNKSSWMFCFWRNVLTPSSEVSHPRRS
jgi:hypothetical protein